MLNRCAKLSRITLFRNSFAQCNLVARSFCSSYEDKYIAATTNAILERCHPSDVALFKKTLSTFALSKSNRLRKNRHDLIISSLSFRATHEMKTVLNWFKSMLESSDEIPLEFSEDPKYSILKQKCYRAFLSYRRKQHALTKQEKAETKQKAKKYTPSDTEKEELERILANIPPQLIGDVTKFLNELQIHVNKTNSHAANQIIDDLLFAAEYHREEMFRLFHMIDLPINPRLGLEKAQREKFQNSLKKSLKKYLTVRSEMVAPANTDNKDTNERKKHRPYSDKYKTDISVDIKTKGTSWTIVDIARYKEQQQTQEESSGEHDKDSHSAATFLSLDDQHKLETEHKIELKPVTRTEVPIEEICGLGGGSEAARMQGAARKLLITNVPPGYRPSELRNAMARIGEVESMQIYSANKFEADIPPPPEKVKDLNKGVKKLSHVQQSVMSDAYAFVVFASDEGFQKMLRDDVSIFGMCLKGYRCKVMDARKSTSLMIELVGSSTTLYWLDVISNFLGSDFEMRCDEGHKDHRPAFLTLQFGSHEEAWRAFMVLERAAEESPDLDFQVSWIRSSWYFKVLQDYRKSKRKSNSYLKKILEVVEENNEEVDKKDSVKKIYEKVDKEGFPIVTTF